MMKWIGRLLCWLGLHRWLVEKQAVPVTVTERWMWQYHQYDSSMAVPVCRTCFRCGKREYVYDFKRNWDGVGHHPLWATQNEIDSAKV